MKRKIVYDDYIEELRKFQNEETKYLTEVFETWPFHEDDFFLYLNSMELFDPGDGARQKRLTLSIMLNKSIRRKKQNF